MKAALFCRQLQLPTRFNFPFPMPFDPNLPIAGTDIDAVEIRGQLNGLKALIDAVPAEEQAALLRRVMADTSIRQATY